MAALFVATGIWYLVLGRWLQGVSQIALSVIVVTFLRVRSIWIDIGYRRGRQSWLISMDEAIRRGLHPSQWLMAELEREGNVTILIRHVDPEGQQDE